MNLGIIAQVSFWTFLLIGMGSGDLGPRWTACFAALWVLGYVASGWIFVGGLLFDSYVAVLAIILLLIVFKGKVR